MGTYKLLLDDDVEDSFFLIAIHCSEEPYKIAFMLNKHLSMQLQRKRNDLVLWKEEMEASYALFRFENEMRYTTYYLVKNKSRREVKNVQTTNSLFPETTSEKTVTTYLLPEFKKADYFLKIESDMDLFPIRKIVSQINEIKEVISAYLVDHDHIKSHTNLIFY
ncbi:MAG: IPExxxVDY family protein [Flavobacteriaceae bacterium]